MKYKRILRCFAAALGSILFFISSAKAVKAGYTVFNGDRTKPTIAITVDDCYDSDNVAEILDLCEQYDVPITFFVIGKALKLEDGALWQRALALGCEIGNHTWGHPCLPDLNAEQIKQSLSRTQEKLDKLLGHSYGMQVMRPPYGSLSKYPDRKSDLWVVEAIAEAGYLHAVKWDVDQTDPDEAMKDVENGSILLYHANPKDVRCLVKLIPTLLERGYSCVTVSELLALPPPVSGASYKEETK